MPDSLQVIIVEHLHHGCAITILYRPIAECKEDYFPEIDRLHSNCNLINCETLELFQIDNRLLALKVYPVHLTF